MFFENFKAVFITMSNSKQQFYSFVFSVGSIEYLMLFFKNFTSIYKFNL